MQGMRNFCVYVCVYIAVCACVCMCATSTIAYHSLLSEVWGCAGDVEQLVMLAHTVHTYVHTYRGGIVLFTYIHTYNH